MRIKHVFWALLLLSAFTLPAKVMTFDNYQKPDGTPMLVPAVQKYATETGKFAIPQKFAVAVPASEKIIVEQLTKELKRFSQTTVAQVSQKAVCTFELNARGTPSQPQGYQIVIRKDGISVRAASTDGLYWGAQTLRNLIRNAAKPELACCTITDWPDFQQRGYFVSYLAIRQGALPDIKKAIDAMSSLKLNWLLVEFADTFPFDSPDLQFNRKWKYTKEELRDLQNFCRARHIELVPTLQVFSHSFWMSKLPGWDKLTEGKPRTPWNSLPCPQNQRARELTRKAVMEQIAFFKPRQFFAMMDEIALSCFPSCPKCKNGNKQQILVDYMKFVNTIFEGTGVQPIYCHDSFISSVGHWTYGDALREAVDKKSMFLWWSYRDVLPAQTLTPFTKYDLTGHTLTGKPLNTWQSTHLLKKNGAKGHTLVFWYYSSNGSLAHLDKETPDSLGGFVNGCDFQWKVSDTRYQDLSYDGTFEMIRRYHPEVTREPIRTEKASSMALYACANAELSGSGAFPVLNDTMLKELNDALAKQPEQFKIITAPGGKYYALRLSGKREEGGRYGIQFTLPGGDNKFKRLSLLTTASRPLNGLPYLSAGVYGKKRYDYAKALQVQLIYEDKTEHTVQLRYRYDITDWNRPFGGFGMRFAVRGIDVKNRFYNFGIYDLDNPHPEKRVRFIKMYSHKLDGVSPAVLAISAWGLEKPFPAAPALDLSKRLYQEPFTAKTPEITKSIKADFEKGMGNVTVKATGRFTAPVKWEIVDETVDTQYGKVLKITVPPSVPRTKNYQPRYWRVDIDLPYSVTKAEKSLFFSYRILHASRFSHGMNYLIYKPGLPDATHWATQFRNNSSWVTVIQPLSRNPNTDAPIKDLTTATQRKISFFFHEVPETVTIYVDGIGDTTSDLLPLNYWTTTCEAEPL